MLQWLIIFAPDFCSFVLDFLIFTSIHAILFVHSHVLMNSSIIYTVRNSITKNRIHISRKFGDWSEPSLCDKAISKVSRCTNILQLFRKTKFDSRTIYSMLGEITTIWPTSLSLRKYNIHIYKVSKYSIELFCLNAPLIRGVK